MEDRIFSREIIGKEVETITGRMVGVLEDLVVDTEDGTIIYLLIATAGNVMGESHKVDEKGRAVEATDRIRIKDNKIVIN
jgi:sporulation protein YlmC with PRC-barrel domain